MLNLDMKKSCFASEKGSRIAFCRAEGVECVHAVSLLPKFLNIALKMYHSQLNTYVVFQSTFLGVC